MTAALHAGSAGRHDVRPRSASNAAIAPDTRCRRAGSPETEASRSVSTHLTWSDPGARRAVSHPQTRPPESTGARARVVEVTRSRASSTAERRVEGAGPPAKAP